MSNDDRDLIAELKQILDGDYRELERLRAEVEQLKTALRAIISDETNEELVKARTALHAKRGAEIRAELLSRMDLRLSGGENSERSRDGNGR